MSRITCADLQAMKDRGEQGAMSIVYDYTTARIADKAGSQTILVGDSAARNVFGYAENAGVSMDEMILLGRAAARGSERALVVVDMPFMSYQVSNEEGVRNAGRFIREAGVQAVKVEGNEEIADVCAAIVRAGIPVQAHMGFTPQTSRALGAHHSDNADAAMANTPEEKFRKAAFALQDAGCFSIMFTQVPPAVATQLTKELRVPTFGGGQTGMGLNFYLSPVNLTVAAIEASPDKYGPTTARVLYDRIHAFVEDMAAGKSPLRN